MNQLNLSNSIRLSVSIITYNEEQNIRDCLESVKWADELIVVDCYSEDRTVQICREYNNLRAYQRVNNPNLNINKNYGFEKTHGQWVLCLDADERVTVQLRDEIENIINNPTNNKYVGYYIPRKNYYFGRWLKHGGNYPDYQLRLFKRGKGRFPCCHVHERLQLDGEPGYFTNPLLHYPYRTVSQYVTKFNFYTSCNARYMQQKAIRINIATIFYYFIIKPATRFISRYIFKLGFLDGMHGFLACVFDFFVQVISFAKYYELTSSSQRVTKSNW